MTENTNNNTQGKHTLTEQFRQLNKLQHFYFGKKRMEAFGRNPQREQGRVLVIIKMQPEISQKELAYLLDMHPQVLNELLAKLEKDDLITRVSSEEDQRSIKITLTDAGLNAINQESESTDEATIFAVLSVDEQVQLSEYIERIINELDKKMPKEEIENFKAKMQQMRHGKGDFPERGRGGHGHSFKGEHSPRFNRGESDVHKFDRRADPFFAAGSSFERFSFDQENS
ncbi:MarR family winged helix-turn-helix transcriptional regulator [Carnobacterium gallinarum]|uniref:MarR family winged helix-turn-helix transcriptional regulator n=1 Tax=Carnobacterium gallinarum TaxID=2749 RepID=UPI000689458E|nr:MarR family transcriptional regulator [Carnobacterium gallinarum]